MRTSPPCRRSTTNQVCRCSMSLLDPNIDHKVAAEQFPPRQYFVLTDAGKPVFVRRVEASVTSQTPSSPRVLSDHDANSDNVTAMIGVVQALVSIFLDDGDKLRCINAGNTRIVFLLRPPLYYVCVSAWGEPESVVSYLLFTTQSLHPLTFAKQDQISS